MKGTKCFSFTDGLEYNTNSPEGNQCNQGLSSECNGSELRRAEANSRFFQPNGGNQKSDFVIQKCCTLHGNMDRFGKSLDIMRIHNTLSVEQELLVERIFNKNKPYNNDIDAHEEFFDCLNRFFVVTNEIVRKRDFIVHPSLIDTLEELKKDVKDNSFGGKMFQKVKKNIKRNISIFIRKVTPVFPPPFNLNLFDQDVHVIETVLIL